MATRKNKISKATLTFNEFVGIEARGNRVHFGFASVERKGDMYVMEGKTGKHTIARNPLSDDFTRLNAHWVPFAEQNKY